MTSILKLILSALFRFIWDKAEKVYQRESRYQANKRAVIAEVENVAREAAERGEAIAAKRESIDDTLLRFERIAPEGPDESSESTPLRIDRPVFGSAYRVRAAGNPPADTGQPAEVSAPDDGNDSGDPEDKRPESKPVGARLGRIVPPT